MKLKSIIFLTSIFLFIVGCSNNDEESIEIFFDPDVSTTTTNLGQVVMFTDYSSGVKSRVWNFPGGTPSTSTEREVSVQFFEVGLINCTIQNTFTNGITDTKDLFIQVGSGLINYNVNKVQAEIGEPITFTDNSNSVQSRLWTFPDGSPATSENQEVEVVFNQEGPVKCKLEVTFLNGIVDVQEISIQIGKEKYPRSVFGFENETQVNDTWQSWISNGTNAMTYSYQNAAGNGANQTNGFLKIDILTPNIECQLYTKGIDGFPNAVLESFKTYEFSFWIKSDVFTTVTAAEVTNENETQAWQNYAWYSPIIEVNNDWSFKTITFQTGNLEQVYSEGTANNVWTQFKFIQPNTGTIYLDEISLKELP